MLDGQKYTDAFTEQRLELIEKIRRKGITDEDVLKALAALPRERFVPRDLRHRAYEDNALPIEEDQTVSQPYTVAYMTSLLRVKEGDKILEIGTGSGYQACILFLMGARVFTVERIQSLYESAKKKFREMGMRINTRHGDGTLGWKQFAPYKGIMVTAAAPAIPKSLLSQIRIGGRIVMPVGDKFSQTMHVVERLDEDDFKDYPSDAFKFVPLIGKEGWSN